MAEREVGAASVAARIEAASRPARTLLWVVTRTDEALTERLIERVWQGESRNLAMLRQIAAELAAMPPPIRAQVEAQISPEVLAQITPLIGREAAPDPARGEASEASASAAPGLVAAETLLAELTSLGVLAREARGDDVRYSAPREVTDLIAAFMDEHPEERDGRTEEPIFQTLGERYLGAFEALVSVSDGGSQDLALDTGRRAIRYLIRAGREDPGSIAGRMIAAGGDVEQKVRLLAEFGASLELSPKGAPRKALRGALASIAALAATLAEGAPGDSGALGRALSLYERAIDAAEETGDAEGYREATALGQRWADALERAGQHGAARDALRRSAANARRAPLSRPEIIAIELAAVRLGIHHGGDPAAQRAALERHIEELRALLRDQNWVEGAAAMRDAARVVEVLARALDLAVQRELAEERWPEALRCIDALEELLDETAGSDHARAVARCQRYVPLARLGQLDEAEAVLSSALDVFREVGDGPAEVGTRSRLADLWDERGEPARAVTAAREALAKSEELDSIEMRAGCHENLSTYLEKAGDGAAAREHQLAELVYRLVARLDVSRALGTLNLDVLRAAARGERHVLPRLTAILEKPAFAPLRQFLAARGAEEAAIEDGIDSLVETVQAGSRINSPTS